MDKKHFSNNQIGKIHDLLVSRLEAVLSRKHRVTFPDKINNKIQLPDIDVDNEVALEIKVINPDEEDYLIDEVAVKSFDQKGMYSTGGTIKTNSIKSSFDDARRQLVNASVKTRIIVLASPLDFQNSQPDYVAYMLKGIESIELGSVNGKFVKVGTKQVSVPVTKKLSDQIDAILYIHGRNLDRSVLMKLNNKNPKIYHEISKKIISLWS